MMLMFASDGRMVIGLTKGNIDRLLALEPATMDGPRPMSVQSLIVIYGDDKPHILAQLEAAGVEIPQAMKDEAERNPE